MIKFLEREMQPILFKDRTEAGRKLGKELKGYKDQNPVVLAIPAGGVPVAVEVAKFLECPLDLVIVRKIQYPWTTEAGFGAATADGIVWLGPEAEKLPPEIVKAQTQKALKEVKHRVKVFLGKRKETNLAAKTAILVDDGLAAGSTMMAAIKSVRKKKPAKIFVAIPTASAGAVNLLKNHADGIIDLYVHPEGLPFAVASSYKNWYDLTDEEVKEYLKMKGEKNEVF